MLKQHPGLLFSFSENEFKQVSYVLAEKKTQGKIKNPTGLLMKNPESVIKQILENSFYPDLQKKKQNDEYEIFSLPKERLPKRGRWNFILIRKYESPLDSHHPKG
ncbi:MAG: hypothetical protein ACOX6L_00020 [Syntrophomonadaceae bacterium]